MSNSVSRKILRFRSVPLPLFQWLNSPTDYCALIERVKPGDTALLTHALALQGSDRCALYAAMVCISNGCRISEILKLSVSSLQPSGFAFVPGSKGSNARQIFTYLPPQVIAQLKASSVDLYLFNVSYNTIYRVCKQVGFTLQIPGHANQAVTHQGRYLNANQATNALGAAAAAGVLGHRGRKTLQGYANPTETQAAVKRRKRQNLSQWEKRKAAEEKAYKELLSKIANGEMEGPVYVV